jgi:signal transduction histidine kinase
VRKRVQKRVPIEQSQPEMVAPERSATTTRDGQDVVAAPPAGEARDSLLLARAEPYLGALLTNTPDAVLVLDQWFRVRDLNPATEVALAGTRAELLGRSCPDVLCCKNLNRMVLCGTSSCPLTKVLQQRIPLPNEELLIGGESPRAREFSVSVTPLAVDNEPQAVLVARDLSALKVANQVRSNFVSMVSHELRTPLNSVHGFIDLLLQGHMGELAEEQQMYLGYAQEGVQQLVSIVEDILFMTRSDLGQFEVKQQEVHLLSLVRQIVRSLHPQAHKAEVVLLSDVPVDLPSLSADPQRMKQVLNNLVTNAIKFTPPGGTVTISARPHDERFAMILVADTGYGIPTEDRFHIFERFYQSNHSEQSKMGGYGLGLSIAKLIIEQHGGTIDFDTVLHKGTTFYFTVPLYLAGTLR